MKLDQQSDYDAMVRRAEHILKALSGSSNGRSRVAVTTRALQAAVDETFSRMLMAWSVLTHANFQAPKHYTYRMQKAAELSNCYALLIEVYDELCHGNVISKDRQTEPTTAMMVRLEKEEERAAAARRRRAGLG